MKRVGKGMALVAFGIGNTGAVNPSAAYVEVFHDGSVQVLAGAADIGQGSDTVLTQIAAEVLGVTIDKVHVVSGDTGCTPDGGATSASRQTYVSGNAVRLACIEARFILNEVAARMLEVRPELLTFSNNHVISKCYPEKNISLTEVAKECRREGRIPLGRGQFNPPFMPLDPNTGQGAPFQTYSFGAQIAEVEVDTETGQVQVLRVWAAYDVGKAINLTGVEGQIEGGVVMGSGQALMEEVLLREGTTLTNSLSTYLLPTSMDAPEVEVFVIESQEPSGPFGAKGLGEPALVPTAAAIANAVADAIGVCVLELPLTPEKILAALGKI